MSEYDTIETLMEEGVDQFHLRKPQSSEEDILKYLNRIPKPYRSRMTIHGHAPLAHRYNLAGLHLPVNTSFENWEGLKSRPFHSFEEIEAEREADYGFLSPIFNSISKEGYESNFSENELSNFLKNYSGKTKIYALGGIDTDNVKKCMDMGFDGVAILGAVWGELWLPKKLEKLKAIRAALDTVIL